MAEDLPRESYFTESGLPVIRAITSEEMRDFAGLEDSLSGRELRSKVERENGDYLPLVEALYTQLFEGDDVPTALAGAIVGYSILCTAAERNSQLIQGDRDSPLTPTQLVEKLKERLSGETDCYIPPLQDLVQRATRGERIEAQIAYLGAYVARRADASKGAPTFKQRENPSMASFVRSLESAFCRVSQAAGVLAGTNPHHGAIFAPLFAALYQEMDEFLTMHAGMYERLDVQESRVDELDMVVDALLREREDLQRALDHAHRRREELDLEEVIAKKAEGTLDRELFLEE